MKLHSLIILSLFFSPFSVAEEFVTPACYQNMPVTCDYDEMQRSFCTQLGQQQNLIFMPYDRISIIGGNIFGDIKREHLCVVKPIANTEPKAYKVKIISVESL